MRSITYAMRAQDLLRAQGWRCDIVRNRTRCGYSLKVWGDGHRAAELLREKGIIPGNISEASP